MNKTNKLDLDSYSPVQLYEMILNGKIKNFPRKFWKNDFSYDYAKEIGFYLEAI